MKPNWTIVAGTVFLVAAVFGLAVLDGFNSVERPDQRTAQVALG